MLWERYYADLVRLAVGLGAGNASAVPDAFGSLLRRPRVLRDQTAAHAWLIRAVLSEARTKRRHGSSSGPSASIAAHLGRLPARQRECLVLRYCAGLPETEVAELLHVPTRSVARLGHDGLRRLAAILGDPQVSPADTAATLSRRVAQLQVPDLRWEAVRPGLVRRRRKTTTLVSATTATLVLAAALAAALTIAGARQGGQLVHRAHRHPLLAIRGDRLPVTLAAEPGFLVYQSGQDLGASAGISAGNAAAPARYNNVALAAGQPARSYSAPSVNSARTELTFVEAPSAQLKETSGEGDIAVSALNGSDLRVLTNTGLDSDPVWSPNGKRIAFLRSNRVWLMKANGTNQHLLGLYLSVDSIAWAPDGKELAVTSIAYPVNRIAIMNIAGVSYTWFTPANSPGQYQPAWSPDGKQLAYGESGQNALFISNLNGSGTRRLTTCSRPCQQDAEPAWSPDGSQIAFVRSAGNRKQVAVVSVRTGQVRIVTTGQQQHDEPSW